MTEVDAIYQAGVFKPVGTVNLRENQRVRLSIQPIETADVRKWLDDIQEMHRQFVAERGYLPDSTPDIARDRMRDV